MGFFDLFFEEEEQKETDRSIHRNLLILSFDQFYFHRRDFIFGNFRNRVQRGDRQFVR